MDLSLKLMNRTSFMINDISLFGFLYFLTVFYWTQNMLSCNNDIHHYKPFIIIEQTCLYDIVLILKSFVQSINVVVLTLLLYMYCKTIKYYNNMYSCYKYTFKSSNMFKLCNILNNTILYMFTCFIKHITSFNVLCIITHCFFVISGYKVTILIIELCLKIYILVNNKYVHISVTGLEHWAVFLLLFLFLKIINYE